MTNEGETFKGETKAIAESDMAMDSRGCIERTRSECDRYRGGGKWGEYKVSW